MIVTRQGRRLVDREALAHLTGRSQHTIRARCTVVRHDKQTGRALYDVADAVAVLDATPTRQRNRDGSPATAPTVPVVPTATARASSPRWDDVPEDDDDAWFR